MLKLNCLRQPWIEIFLLVICIASIYSLGLPGGMIFDDEPNLWMNPRFVFTNNDWENFVSAIFSNRSGPTGRPISLLTFAINQWFFGLDNILPYKITNIFIHCLSTIATFFLAQKLLTLFTRNENSEKSYQQLAFIIALVWGLHPLQLTSVLYIVQRMTSLAALFSFISIIFYLKFREKQLGGSRFSYYISSLIISVIALTFAILSKESALVVFLYFSVLEVWIFNFSGHTKPQTTVIRFLYVSLFIIGSSLILLKIWFNPGFLMDGYKIRDFTLYERLLTQTRVVFFYLKELLLPDINNLGIYHDDFVVSKDFSSPITTLICSLFWTCALIVVALPKLRKAFPLLSFGLAWFMVGHLLESTIWPLEMVHEHRNYFPSFGVLFALTLIIKRYINHHQVRNEIQKTLAIVFILFLSASTAWRASVWSDPIELALTELRNHPTSTRANYDAGRFLMYLYEKERKPELKIAAQEAFTNTTKYGNSNSGIGFLGLIYLEGVDRKPASDNVISSYKNYLSKALFTDIALGQLEKLNEHQLDGTTALSDEQYFSLLDAYLTNPRLTYDHRASVYVLFGNYYAKKVNELKKAEKFFLEAKELTPNKADKYIALAWIYAMNKDYPRTKEMLILAKQQPDAWQYRNKIDWSSIDNEPK